MLHVHSLILIVDSLANADTRFWCVLDPLCSEYGRQMNEATLYLLAVAPLRAVMTVLVNLLNMLFVFCLCFYVVNIPIVYRCVHGKLPKRRVFTTKFPLTGFL